MNHKINTLLILLTVLLFLALTSCAEQPQNNQSASSTEASTNTSSADVTSTPESTGVSETTGEPDNAAPVNLNDGETLLSSALHSVTGTINGEKKAMRVRVSVIGSAAATSGKIMQLELLGDDGAVLDFKRCAGFGFISIKKSENDENTEFALYGISVRADKSFSAGVIHCYIWDCERDGSKAENPGFVYLEDNCSVNASVGSPSLEARWKNDMLNFSHSADNILRSYIDMPVAAYCNADKYGTPADGELLYTEAINEHVSALTIDDIADMCKD